MLRRIALVVSLSLAAASPVWGQEWARKMFKVGSHDFGTVARNAKAEFEFVLTNLYLEDVHVASVQTSCGCTTPTITKPWLKTYEQGSIRAHFNTDSFLGSRAATLTVTIDKPFFAEVQLQVRGLIRSDVLLSPGSVQLGTVDQGTSAARTITVNYTGWNNWQVQGVRSANPYISAKVTPTRRTGGQVEYALAVQLDPKTPPGYVRDQLVLITNDRQSPQIPVTVEGMVAPAITVSPAALFMGVVQPGNAVTKPLVIRGKKPFRILSITCDDKSFEFQTPTDPTPKTIHVVPVKFVAGADSGKVNRTIRIETDLGGQTVPSLPAVAVVTPQAAANNP